MLLPPGIVAVSTTAAGSSAGLLGAEARALGRASPRRIQEFAAGRICARRALAELGLPVVAIGRGPNRQPLWPRGVVGSITHCTGYCAAAVTRSAEIASVGIDAEVHDVLPAGVMQRIALPSEAQWIRDRLGEDNRWARILFSAKEAVFKAWFPLTRRWLGFHDAEVVFDIDAGTFEANLSVRGPILDGRPIQRFDGRFLVRDGFVLTAIVLAVEGSD